MLQNKLGDYEEALEKHISRLEDDTSQRQIQLNAGLKLEITRIEGAEAVKRKLNNDIRSLSKNIASIEFDSLQERVEKTENDVECLQSDADLVVSILKKACKNHEKEENILRENLEEIKKDLQSILAVKSTFKATDQYVQIHVSKCENEIEKLINMKTLQDLYIGRLRADIVYAELGVGSLVEVLTNISQNKKTSFLKLSELMKTLKRFAEPQSTEANQWENCLSFAILENHLGSSIFLKQTDTVDLEIKEIERYVIINYKNEALDKICNIYRNKISIIRNYLHHQREYNSALKLRFIGAKIRNRALSTQILSHLDPIQEKLFEAELKSEIRKLLCTKMAEFLKNSANVHLEIKPLSRTSEFSIANVQLFLPDSRATELLTNCQKQRKAFTVAERKKAALFFRFQRLRDEVKEAKSSNEVLEMQRRLLERKLFEAESQHDPLFSLETDEQIEIRKDEKLNLQKVTDEARFERENLQNEINVLSQKLKFLREQCDKLRQQTGSLSYYQKKHGEFNLTLQKVTQLLATRHELLSKQFEIQKKLKAIISRRECAFTSFTNTFQNRESVDPFKSEYQKMLEATVQNLKDNVKATRDKLLKYHSG